VAGAVGMPLLGETSVGLRRLVERGVAVEPEHGVRVHPRIVPRPARELTATRRSMLACMAATPTPESTPQRLAAIRAQMSLLADYL
jgi:DNA-binding GntR family transcriptional regulator